MFDTISDKFQDISRRIFSGGKLTEKNIEEAIREIRTALLEADVNYGVAKTFIQRVKEKALGEQLVKSVKAREQFIAIVFDELVSLMGPVDTSISFAEKRATVIMMAGLQGSGKTTTCGKMAKFLIKKGHRPLLVAADIQRPGAIEQLQILGETLGVPVFSEPNWTPPKICAKAVAEASKKNCDVVILDTAGRLHIDEGLMKELGEIKKKTKPDNIFLVTDSMTGQDAVNSAQEFHKLLGLDGVVLTKLDGDTRGGAALSIREVAGCPIKFVGMGETLDRLEEFDPQRMASRILGEGDLAGIAAIAKDLINEEEAEKIQEKMLSGQFTLNDFLDQFSMMKKMGGFSDLMGMLPKNMLPPGAQEQLQSGDAENMIKHTEAMIHSMTPQERNHPDVLDGSRRLRVAKGSGKTIQDVNQLLKQFQDMRKMMGNMGQMGGFMDKLMGGGGGLPSMAGGLPGMGGMGGMSGKMRSKRKKKPRRKK